MNNIQKSRFPIVFVWLYENLSMGVRFITKRKRLSTHHDFAEPFFIIGSGRSGNTLLRAMLLAGKQVSIPPESYVWPRILRRFNAISFLPWDFVSSIVIGEFEAYKAFNTWEVNLFKAHSKARDLPKKKQTLSYLMNVIYTTHSDEKGQQIKRWGDKTPINTIYIDKLMKIFPKAQYVHIVRDPRDVVCSYVKAGLYQNYSDALDFWMEANRKATKMKTLVPKDQYWILKYEDLVEFPERELKKLCNFLDVDYSVKLLDFWKNYEEMGDVKMRKHHKNLQNPLSTKSIGKWKNTLSRNESREIEQKAQKEMIAFGYLN